MYQRKKRLGVISEKAQQFCVFGKKTNRILWQCKGVGELKSHGYSRIFYRTDAIWIRLQLPCRRNFIFALAQTAPHLRTLIGGKAKGVKEIRCDRGDLWELSLLYGALMSEMRGIALHHERLKCRGSNRKLIY